MSNIIIQNSVLNGTVNIPSSKSFAHRALICAALSGGNCSVFGIDDSADILATFGALKSIGVNIKKTDNAYITNGFCADRKNEIFCNESGSTLRFMLPIAAAVGGEFTFTGAGRLPKRPIDTLTELFKCHNIECSADTLPLTIKGKLTGGEFKIAGNVSSQYISGLLLAAPLINEDVKITLTSPLESKAYVDITVSVMKAFGVNVTTKEDGWFVDKHERYCPCDYTVEGDWSQSAFFMVAGAIGGNIKIRGLNKNSVQGDMQVLDILTNMGADINFEGDCLVAKKSTLVATDINAEQIPDAVPALSVAAAFAVGTTKIYGAARLRLKESDRISAVANGLKNMGISVIEHPDGLEITGDNVTGGVVNGENDHRIVMAFSVAAAYAKGKTLITDKESINKSYPLFFEDFKKLKGVCKSDAVCE